ncbi:MAG: adenylate/guanylate cyclase domain-containing protein [Burkholderiaceae bacterium]|nr:adenylate/guanylate cyclase domain-containing protein [Burkholderiaceae bacterium]
MVAARLLSRVRRRLLGLALTSVAALCAFDVVPVALVQTLDQSIYDTRLRLASSTPDDRVVIVDIDEASIARMGRWPWDRSRMGELASSLVERGGAAVVGIDIVFAEPQREADEDAALAQRLRGHPVVLGYYFTSDRGGRTSGALPAPVLSSQALAGLGIGITAWDGFGANLVSLQEAAAGGGFFNPLIDGDGTVRALPLLAEFRGGLYESFAVAVLRQWLGSASLQLSADALSLRGARGSLRLPLSDALTALVPFAGRVADSRGPAPRFAYVPAADVLEGRADWSRFKDRIVLIGTSAPGLTDLRATPLRAAFPGVEIHATMISAALASVEQAKAGGALLKSRSDVSAALGALAAGVIGGLLALGLPALGALGAVTLSLVAAITLWGSATIAWNNLGLAMPVSAALALVVALLLLNLTVGYFVEGRKRRAVAALFGEYVSPALVERMVRDPARFALVGSENRELTILFVDIRGFTRIAETMPPERLREYINAFLTGMTEVVHRYGGTVDKYIGDAVMAFWGAPLDDAQHADHAVAAALSMLEEVQRLNRGFEEKGLPLMRVGIGINTGEVRVGDMGSRLRRTYTVIGDAVNLASRFEALTKHYDAAIIVGETTVELARGHRFVALGKAQVAGRNEPVMVYSPASLAVHDTMPMSGGHEPPPPHVEDRVNAGARIGM